MILNAQLIEDGLRWSLTNGVISPRAGALGVSYYGISDDFSAIAYNPAGLSLINKGEVSLGLGFLKNSTTTDYWNNSENLSSNDAYISNIGLVSPIKTTFGNASFAIGYYIESNLDNQMQFSGFNSNSTYIDYTAKDAKDRNWGIQDNFATYLWLADDNFNTPIKKDLQQEARISESGGMHNFSGAMAFELNSYLSAGASISSVWGRYKYFRQYSESDINNEYNQIVGDAETGYQNLDFNRLDVDETLNQSVSGITGRFGLMGRIGNFMRISLNVKFPSALDVEENFSQKATSYFDNKDSYDTTYYGTNSYSLMTPWVYSIGMSAHFVGATITAGLEYTDASQIEFYNSLDEMQNLNVAIPSDLTGQLKWGVGLEYRIPVIPVVIRGSYNYANSPWVGDNTDYDVKTIAFGAGVYLAKKMRLDFMARLMDYKDMWNVYGSSNDTRLFITRQPIDFGMQFTYRY